MGILEDVPDSPGEPKIGTQVHEELKLACKEYVTDTSVVSVEPGTSYRFAGEGTSRTIRGLRRVSAGATPGSAVFTYDLELELRAVPYLARPLLTWWLQRSMRRDLGRLRRLVEGA